MSDKTEQEIVDERFEKAHEEKRKKQEEAFKQQHDNLKRVVHGVCETKSGIELFRVLRGWCDMDKSPLHAQLPGLETSEILLISEAKRILYLALEKHIPLEVRPKIDYPTEVQKSPEEKPNTNEERLVTAGGSE